MNKKPTACKHPPWMPSMRAWLWMVRFGERAPLSIVEQIRVDAKKADKEKGEA